MLVDVQVDEDLKCKLKLPYKSGVLLEAFLDDLVLALEQIYELLNQARVSDQVFYCQLLAVLVGLTTLNIGLALSYQVGFVKICDRLEAVFDRSVELE